MGELLKRSSPIPPQELSKNGKADALACAALRTSLVTQTGGETPPLRAKNLGFVGDFTATQKPRPSCVKGAPVEDGWGIVFPYATIPPSRLRRATSLYTREAYARRCHIKPTDKSKFETLATGINFFIA